MTNETDLLPKNLYCKKCSIGINTKNLKAIEKHKKNCSATLSYLKRIEQDKKILNALRKLKK